MLPIEDATAASYNHSILYRRTLLRVMGGTEKAEERLGGIVPVTSTPFRSSTREPSKKTTDTPNVQGTADTQEPCLRASGIN